MPYDLHKHIVLPTFSNFEGNFQGFYVAYNVCIISEANSILQAKPNPNQQITLFYCTFVLKFATICVTVNFIVFEFLLLTEFKYHEIIALNRRKITE